MSFALIISPPRMKLPADQFQTLAMEQMDVLYRVARRMVRSDHAAEDLVQETYLRAFRSADSFNLEAFGIRPWLLRIMHNLNVSRGMREKKQPKAMEDEQLDVAAVSIEPLPANALEGMDDQLKQAFEGLGEEYRTVLHLWAIEELSYKEIADALDVPIGTVMSRLHRARGKLSNQLKDYAQREGRIPRSRE
ncbi:MAG TPA: sigma-70 family RNA polymerase sigma factor [Tepidisphaeraceae bacterium]|nr:sigma-70 family RNA polymerase sigma factor [Tepidisphaeraceae bacterium]